MPYKYTGRAKVLLLEPDGKPYGFGDMVPIARDRALALVRSSNLHSFEGLDADEAPAPAPAEPKAREDAAKK